jgi:release factor glutamine methyltransferase
VAERASWLRADALETVSGRFHMLIANPPYVRTGDIPSLDPEVCKFDPILSLDGGADGLAMYRRLAPRIAGVVPNGWVVLEVGFDQADEVQAIICNEVHASERRACLDVAGKRRCVAVKTRA